MFDRELRRLKELLLRPLVYPPFSLIHPNIITLIAFALGITSGWAVLQGEYRIGLFLWFANRILDGLDGAMARATDRQTDFGAYLDIMTDFAVYAWIPIAFVLRPLFGSAFLPDKYLLISILSLLGAYYLNAASWMYLSALLEKRRAGAADRGESTSVTMPSGLVEGFETILFYTVFFLRPNQLSLLFGLLAALVLFSVLQRFIWAARVLRGG